jgi:hypothetical protein
MKIIMYRSALISARQQEVAVLHEGHLETGGGLRG